MVQTRSKTQSQAGNPQQVCQMENSQHKCQYCEVEFDSKCALTSHIVKCQAAQIDTTICVWCKASLDELKPDGSRRFKNSSSFSTHKSKCKVSFNMSANLPCKCTGVGAAAVESMVHTSGPKSSIYFTVQLSAATGQMRKELNCSSENFSDLIWVKPF